MGDPQSCDTRSDTWSRCLSLIEMCGEFGLRRLAVWIGGEQVLLLDALLTGEPPLLVIVESSISYYFMTELRLYPLG